jgi:cytidyltransferase-like protein
MNTVSIRVDARKPHGHQNHPVQRPGPVAPSLGDAYHPMMVTSGCFDILHHGHVTQLQRMLNLGKFLLVGTNSDASIRAIKPGRPIIDENNRALMLAALACLEALIIFHRRLTMLNGSRSSKLLKSLLFLRTGAIEARGVVHRL